jgi:hypothetical protein
MNGEDQTNYPGEGDYPEYPEDNGEVYPEDGI